MPLQHLFWLRGCSSFSNRGEVDKPYIEAANTYQFSFENVALTDSSTVVTAIVRQRPGSAIFFDSAIAIVAGGKEYPVISIDNLGLGESYVMPDSAVARFTMRFRLFRLRSSRLISPRMLPTGGSCGAFSLTLTMFMRLRFRQSSCK